MLKKKIDWWEFYWGLLVIDEIGCIIVCKFMCDGLGLIIGLWEVDGLIEIFEEVLLVDCG